MFELLAYILLWGLLYSSPVWWALHGLWLVATIVLFLAGFTVSIEDEK